MPTYQCPTCHLWKSSAQSCDCPSDTWDDRLRARRPQPAVIPEISEAWREGLRRISQAADSDALEVEDAS